MWLVCPYSAGTCNIYMHGIWSLVMDCMHASIDDEHTVTYRTASQDMYNNPRSRFCALQHSAISCELVQEPCVVNKW